MESFTPRAFASTAAFKAGQAGEMNDVARGSGVFKEGREASCTFRLNGFRPTRLVPLGTCFAFGEQRLLQTADQLRILAMSCDDHAQFLRQGKRLIHFAIVYPKKVFVGKEDFEGSRPVTHDLAQLGLRVLIESAYRHMEGVIAGAPVLGFILPQAISCQRVLRPGWAAHLNYCCRAADECRHAGRLMSIFGKRRHEGQIDVYMRIDEPGEDPLSACIDYLRTGWNRQIRANSGDRLILNVYLGFVASIRSYNFAVPN
jgi:hypothetical protein